MFYIKSKKFHNFFEFQGLNYKINLIAPEPKNLQSNLKVISYALNNNFSYTQLFRFLLQKDSYYVHDDTEAFFVFLL